MNCDQNVTKITSASKYKNSYLKLSHFSSNKNAICANCLDIIQLTTGGPIQGWKTNSTIITLFNHIPEYQSKSLSMCHRSVGIRGRASISFQCFVSFGPLLLPTMTPPIFSFGPMWSRSITEIERAVRRIRSYETLKTNDSLKQGSVVLCFVCVFCFSTFLSSYSNQIFTYGSEKHKT